MPILLSVGVCSQPRKLPGHQTPSKRLDTWSRVEMREARQRQRRVTTAPAGNAYWSECVPERTANEIAVDAPLSTIRTVEPSSPFLNATLWRPPTSDVEATRRAPGRTKALACASA